VVDYLLPGVPASTLGHYCTVVLLGMGIFSGATVDADLNLNVVVVISRGKWVRFIILIHFSDN
jgi:hypothetical protein